MGAFAVPVQEGLAPEKDYGDKFMDAPYMSNTELNVNNFSKALGEHMAAHVANMGWQEGFFLWAEYMSDPWIGFEVQTCGIGGAGGGSGDKTKSKRTGDESSEQSNGKESSGNFFTNLFSSIKSLFSSKKEKGVWVWDGVDYGTKEALIEATTPKPGEYDNDFGPVDYALPEITVYGKNKYIESKDQIFFTDLPDYCTIGIEGCGIIGVGVICSFDFTWVMNGPQSSFFPIFTVSIGGGIGYNLGISINGDILNYSGEDFNIERLYIESLPQRPTAWIQGGPSDILYGGIGYSGSIVSDGYLHGPNGSIGLSITFPFTGAVGAKSTFILYDFWGK